jgi:hypothetical protein
MHHILIDYAWACHLLLCNAYWNTRINTHKVMHRRMGRGGARGGHVLPQNFYGRAKINAKFGQNIKISGKFWYVQKKYLYLCENDAMLGKFFWYVRKIFFDMSGKKFLVTRPRSPTILGENINVQFACSGKLYCAAKTRLGPYDHVVMNSTKIRQCNFMSKNLLLHTNEYYFSFFR